MKLPGLISEEAHYLSGHDCFFWNENHEENDIKLGVQGSLVYMHSMDGGMGKIRAWAVGLILLGRTIPLLLFGMTTPRRGV